MWLSLLFPVVGNNLRNILNFCFYQSENLLPNEIQTHFELTIAHTIKILLFYMR